MMTSLRTRLQGAALALSLVFAPALMRAGLAPAPYSSDRLAAELTRAISDHFSAEGDLQLDLLRPWTPPAQTAAVWRVAVTQFPETLSTTMVLRCRILADGVAVDEPTFMVRAQLWRDVWFTRQPLESGSWFMPSSLEARRDDVLRDRSGLPASVVDSNLMFARDVPADRMLTWHDIARRTLVHKGEVVDVVAGEGGLSFTMKALALQNGASGDLILLRNMESMKDIAGQVIEIHRVEVRF